ncbi:MAG: glutathione S-transferase N-terminal domain-containing protein [Myxococcota bacterium]|nr:glutathione S-transferase N-terminal domain-containing protein [Deltaproteobacteria bacterium]MDQ3334720.1 glutathione S-transferase N-terminal domain-containing protein [Myxococcota bacterium]
MIDAYVWTTPNGFKLLIGLEELALPYKPNWIDITKGDQMKPEYLAINPNNKIPAVVDHEGPGGKPITVFESGAVLTYLADKTGKLLAASGHARYTALEWVFFNAGGTGPMIGQLGYFTKYAQEKVPPAIERFTKETERLLRVLDKRLGETQYLAGDFSIADIMNFTWADAARTFIGMDISGYKNVTRWLDELQARPAFAKAMAMKPGA